MNIKEHIEAGHYERDEHCAGWSVTLRNNSAAKIFTTKCGGPYPLVGVVSVIDRGWETIKWAADGTPEKGSSHWSCNFDLLPPPPRKVKVIGWAIISPSGVARRICANPHSSDVIGAPSLGDRVVELTGEYEEPWP